MARNGKNLKINFEADGKDAENVFEKITKRINSFSKETKKSLSVINNLSGSINGIFKGLGVLKESIMLVGKTFDDLTNSAKNQIKAEKQLEIAARNNPYVDKAGVSALKNYASELQKISTIGDEETIPMMAQLVSRGRSVTEVQTIMAAALDYSAGEWISLDAAMNQLNATMSGNIGLMGKQIPELKKLTKEELAQGKAVDIIAKKYAGMSKDLTSATGTSQQLANTWGDFKEYIGLPFLAIRSGLESAANGFLSVINKGLGKIKGFTDQVKEETEEAKKILVADETYDYFKNNSDAGKKKTLDKNSLEKNKALLETGERLKNNADERANNMQSDINSVINAKTKKERAKAEKEILSLYGFTADEVKEQIENEKKLSQEIDNTNNLIRARISEQEKELASANAEAKAQAEAAERAKKKAENDEKAAKMIKDSNEALDREIEKIRLENETKRAAGEIITEEAENQQILNARIDSYISLIEDSEGLITQDNSAAQERLKTIKKSANQIKLTAEEQSQYNDILKKFGEDAGLSARDALKGQIEGAEKLAETLKEKGLSEEYDNITGAIRRMKDELKNMDFNETLKGIESVTSQITSYVDKVASISNSITTLLSENVEATTGAESAKLETMYEKGLISYEEYCFKKQKIEEEAAQKEYEIQTWAWGVQLLQAQASTALAMVQTLADTTITSTAAKVAMMALTGALGAAQTAAIIAAKPQAPSFATGGIVGGSSYTGDKVRANVNSGEMILNARQQMELWKLANGRNGGNNGASMQVEINNTISDRAEVSTSIQEGRLIATISGVVNAEMKKGIYTDSMIQAQSDITGRRYQ